MKIDGMMIPTISTVFSEAVRTFTAIQIVFMPSIHQIMSDVSEWIVDTTCVRRKCVTPSSILGIIYKPNYALVGPRYENTHLRYNY